MNTGDSGLLQARGILMCISKNQRGGLTDLPHLYQTKAGIERAVDTAPGGSPGAVQFAQI